MSGCLCSFTAPFFIMMRSVLPVSKANKIGSIVSICYYTIRELDLNDTVYIDSLKSY